MTCFVLICGADDVERLRSERQAHPPANALHLLARPRGPGRAGRAEGASSAGLKAFQQLAADRVYRSLRRAAGTCGEHIALADAPFACLDTCGGQELPLVQFLRNPPRRSGAGPAAMGCSCLAVPPDGVRPSLLPLVPPTLPLSQGVPPGGLGLDAWKKATLKEGHFALGQVPVSSAELQQ